MFLHVHCITFANKRVCLGTWEKYIEKHYGVGLTFVSKGKGGERLRVPKPREWEWRWGPLSNQCKERMTKIGRRNGGGAGGGGGCEARLLGRRLVGTFHGEF